MKVKGFNRTCVLIVVFLVLFVPFPTTIVDTWEVQVVDIAGNPAKRVEVRQTWRTGYGGEETDVKWSDETGKVEFPARRITLPLSFRVLLGLVNWIASIVMPHGKENSSGAIVWSPFASSRNWLHYEAGQPLPNNLYIFAGPSTEQAKP